MKKQIFKEDDIALFIDHACPSTGECKFDGACYGEICIGTEYCGKEWSRMTNDEKTKVNQIRKELSMRTFIPPLVFYRNKKVKLKKP